MPALDKNDIHLQTTAMAEFLRCLVNHLGLSGPYSIGDKANICGRASQPNHTYRAFRYDYELLTTSLDGLMEDMKVIGAICAMDIRAEIEKGEGAEFCLTSSAIRSIKDDGSPVPGAFVEFCCGEKNWYFTTAIQEKLMIMEVA